LTGEAVFGEAGAADNLFDVLVGLRNSLENNDVHGVQSRLDQLNIIQVGLTSSLADIGSRLNRIEMSGNILNNLELSNTDRLTEIEDVDAIQAITDLNARQLVYEAALYSATQVGQLSLVDFMR
jgi:flagellar hook-associated protein 3 FlgL